MRLQFSRRGLTQGFAISISIVRTMQEEQEGNNCEEVMVGGEGEGAGEEGFDTDGEMPDLVGCDSDIGDIDGDGDSAQNGECFACVWLCAFVTICVLCMT